MLGFLVVVSMVLCQCLGLENLGPKSIQKLVKRDTQAKAYKSADHYWPLAKIVKKYSIVKDECGKTNAKLSEDVTTKNDFQLGTVVSLQTSDSLVMSPFKSSCITNPTDCQQGITIEFWLMYRGGEHILTSGGYTKRVVGPGFKLTYNSKHQRLEFLISTRTKLWTVHFPMKKAIWVHLMFTWDRSHGLVVYENGEVLTKDENAEKVTYPKFETTYETLTVGDRKIFKLRSGDGARLEMGHLVIWIRRLPDQEIRKKAFMAFVRPNPKCCKRKSSDPCVSDGCFKDETRCNNIDNKYLCLCPGLKVNKTCRYADPTVDLSYRAADEDSKIMIVAIAVGVACVLMLLTTIAVVMARLNNKRQGEFIPRNHLSEDSITADPNTQDVIAASVDPAPRITDVPFKAAKVKKTSKKTTKVKLSEYPASQI